MTTVSLSQLPIELHLIWKQGDAVALELSVADVDWTGTYVGNIVVDGENVALTVTAALNATYTDFTFTLAAASSADIPVGAWPFTARIGDVTRFSGQAIVE